MGFFNTDQTDDQQTEQQDNEEKIEKLKVGEKEYSQDELQRLVSLGEIGLEAEKRYNTKLDKVWPSFHRNQEELKQVRGELEAIKQNAQQQVSTGELTQDEAVTEARKAAKNLGIILDENFEEKMAGSFRKYYVQEREAERLLDDMEKLEKDIDGSDGIRPAFDKEEILYHMRDTGIRNPLKAYKDKYEETWGQWQSRQLNDSKRGGFFTSERGSSEKKPPEVKVNSGNLKSLISEVLGS